jgi:ribosomal protein S18 acetylase RimI-like enzyme
MSATAAEIRHTIAADRAPILAFMQATGFFRPDELEVAAEVLDEALKAGPAGHYQSFAAVSAGAPVGWVCVGPTPCTLGTFDLYWIAVAPAAQGHGVGSLLLRHAETLIRARQGRLVVIETSGQPRYDATRFFYLKNGYAETARLPDFYAPGDDKVVYLKRLDIAGVNCYTMR